MATHNSKKNYFQLLFLPLQASKICLQVEEEFFELFHLYLNKDPTQGFLTFLQH